MAKTESGNDVAGGRGSAGGSTSGAVATSSCGKIVSMAVGAVLVGILYNADRRIRWMNAFRDFVVGSCPKCK